MALITWLGMASRVPAVGIVGPQSLAVIIGGALVRSPGPEHSSAVLGRGIGPHAWAEALVYSSGPRHWSSFLGGKLVRSSGPGHWSAVLGRGTGPNSWAGTRVSISGPGHWSAVVGMDTGPQPWAGALVRCPESRQLFGGPP